MVSRRLLFVITEDWYFWSHRQHLATAAIAAGWQVALATNVNEHAERIAALGVKLYELEWDRGGLNPLAEWRVAKHLRLVVRDFCPDIVHNVALKPILHSVWMPSGYSVVNAVTGLGYLFTGGEGRARMLRIVVQQLLRRALARVDTCTVVQNDDDFAVAQDLTKGRAKVMRIEGVGIDTDYFAALPEPAGPVRIAMVSRLLWDKGIGELVDATRELRARGLEFVVELVGTPDPANRASIPIEQVQAWCEEGLVEWRGWSADVREVWTRAHIAVLPSYREGLPKSLLEAAACGRPLVATDVPGCRSVVDAGISGLLVPRADGAALADALARLVNNAKLRQQMGAAARAAAESRFSATHISGQFNALYAELMQRREARA